MFVVPFGHTGHAGRDAPDAAELAEEVILSMIERSKLCGVDTGDVASLLALELVASLAARNDLPRLGSSDLSDEILADVARVALAYVARGEAPLGIVYETDARAEPKVKLAGVFPESSHAPILYPEALTKDAKPEAKAFFAYLSSPAAHAVFAKDGFRVK